MKDWAKIILVKDRNIFEQFVTTLTQGEGYGGGASYKDNEGETLGVGLPGVVLIDMGRM